MTKIIYTRKGEEILVDDEDYESLNQHVWCISARGYVVRNIRHPLDPSKKSIERMHRRITGLEFGDPRVADHINRNTLDNRRSNLRVCLQSENMRNVKLRADNTSGCKGVCFHKPSGLWHALIHVDGRRISLGYFGLKEDAIETYQEAAKDLHGEFANYGA